MPLVMLTVNTRNIMVSLSYIICIDIYERERDLCIHIYIYIYEWFRHTCTSSMKVEVEGHHGFWLSLPNIAQTLT